MESQGARPPLTITLALGVMMGSQTAASGWRLAFDFAASFLLMGWFPICYFGTFLYDSLSYSRLDSWQRSFPPMVLIVFASYVYPATWFAARLIVLVAWRMGSHASSVRAWR